MARRADVAGLRGAFLLTIPLLLLAVFAGADDPGSPAKATQKTETKQAKEIAKVREAFAAVRAAVVAGDGETFARLVTRDSLRLYGLIRDLAVYADQEELQGVEATVRMTVLSLRLRAPREVLLHKDPRALIAYAVENGMIISEEINQTKIGEVLVKGREALVSVSFYGKPARGFFIFRSEHGWKIDLEHLVNSSRGLVDALARKQEVSEETILLELLSKAVGKPVGREVWQPLEARRAK
jgi:hypothetical protein